MNYWELIEIFMEQGWSEDDACKEAYAICFPDEYDPENYE